VVGLPRAVVMVGHWKSHKGKNLGLQVPDHGPWRRLSAVKRQNYNPRSSFFLITAHPSSLLAIFDNFQVISALLSFQFLHPCKVCVPSSSYPSLVNFSYELGLFLVNWFKNLNPRIKGCKNLLIPCISHDFYGNFKNLGSDRQKPTNPTHFPLV
jgi:hypothetical protein